MDRLARRQPRAGQPQRTPQGRATTVLVCLLAGFMITVSAVAARGTDLRSDRSSDMRDLIAAQTDRNRDLRKLAEGLRAEVQELTQNQSGGDDTNAALEAAGLAASTVAVAGPGVRVSLTDAPLDVKPAGVDDDSLVVHQQDIQAVVNALWAGGAEAMTIQGQRVVATTGIKCVGNSVVLHGVPYAPPYVIEAIGDQERLEAALGDSRPVQIFRQYVAAYGLGYEQSRTGRIEAPAFVGVVGGTEATRSN